MIDNNTFVVDMSKGILTHTTKKARGNTRDRELVLVTHATRGSKSIVDERKMMREKKRGGRNRQRIRRDRGKQEIGGGGWGKGGGEKRMNFSGKMRKTFIKEDVKQNNFVNRRARRERERDEGPVREVTATPEINCGSVTMLTN